MAILFSKTTTLIALHEKSKIEFKGEISETGAEFVTSLINSKYNYANIWKSQRASPCNMHWTQILKDTTIIMQIVVLQSHQLLFYICQGHYEKLTSEDKKKEKTE